MRWTFLTVVVLAALSVSSANGSSVSQTRARNRAQTATTPHTAPTHSVQTKANRPSPQEVGRAAGLKIRHDLAKRYVAAAPSNQQRVASSQSHPRPNLTTHQSVIAKASSRTPEPSASTEDPTDADAAEAPARTAEHTANLSRSMTVARSSNPVPSATRAKAVAPVRATNSQNAVRQSEVASLQPSPFAQSQAAPAVAGPFAEPNPLAQATRSAVTRPTNEPTTEVDFTADADAQTKDADTADTEASATEVPAAEAISADAPVAQTRALTRGAAIRAVSLHTSRYGMPAPLVGSRAILEHQNAMSDAEGLERILDEDDLADRIASRLLVPVPTSIALTINGNLPVNHRYCRPWTALFLSDLARSHAAEFHRPLEVSSAVRTVAYQKRLMGINGNAAAAEGDIVSPHLTGATIDIAKSPLSRQEIAWMRAQLLLLEQAGKIDVEEEFQQACFHITVYKSYAPLSHRGTPTKAAHPKSAQPDSSQTDIAQADTAQPDSARASTVHATHGRRRHSHRRIEARTADPSSGIASRGL
jgi:Family of unknown function (DUF5715)